MAQPYFMWCAIVMYGNTSCGKGIQAYNAVNRAEILPAGLSVGKPIADDSGAIMKRSWS